MSLNDLSLCQTVWLTHGPHCEGEEGKIVAIRETHRGIYAYGVQFKGQSYPTEYYRDSLSATKPIPEDRYLDGGNVVSRLMREYEKHGRLLIAVDYDDTLKPYHHTDETCPRVVNLVRRASDLGFLITIYTASSPDRWEGMRAFCAANGIKVASVNENPIELPFGLWGKVYYNLFLCDRAGLASSYAALLSVVSAVERVEVAKAQP